jgi:type VII secretion protein EccB
MWTQRDQLQAYQYLRRRLVSAVQRGDANHSAPPSRRLLVAYALGATAMLLIVAGFGIYGLLRPGANQNWKKPGQVVIEKESGAAYVLGADGLLHPMLNYASARLLAGGDGSATSTVSARSLASVPRGEPLGIAGAPDSLPARDRLLTGPWSICSATPPDRPSGTAAATTAAVGVPATGLQVPADRALLVQDAAGETTYLVVAGAHLRLVDTAGVVLGLDKAPVKVPASWLSAVPAGPDLRLIAVPGSGARGPDVGGRPTRVGQVFVVEGMGSGDRYYVVHESGLAAVTRLQALLILGDRDNAPAYPDGNAQAVPVSASAIAAAVSDQQPSSAYPANVPELVDTPAETVAVCAVFDGAQSAQLRIAPRGVLPAGAKAMRARRDGGDARIADAVFVLPGHGALVRERQSEQAETGALYLLTDQGIRYPIGGDDAVARLGYGGVRPAPVDQTILALFPLGPMLDVAGAEKVAG